MPITIPPFAQFQGTLVPLRGLWNKAPPEGDKFVNAEIDWIAATGGYSTVQFALSGNSPVALSQIVALFVDNGRCGSDASFVFPDSGFELVVPAKNQGLFPVLTNALTFYATAAAALAGDVTIVQILNSMPPLVPITPSSAQAGAHSSAMPLQTNGSTAVVPAGVNGTLETISISIGVVTTAAAGYAGLSLVDGTGVTIWQQFITAPATTNQQLPPINLTGLTARFRNGLNFVIASSSFNGGWIGCNLFYSTP